MFAVRIYDFISGLDDIQFIWAPLDQHNVVLHIPPAFMIPVVGMLQMLGHTVRVIERGSLIVSE